MPTKKKNASKKQSSKKTKGTKDTFKSLLNMTDESKLGKATIKKTPPKAKAPKKK